jgi:O-antigen/teichoic acid export membrane protein
LKPLPKFQADSFGCNIAKLAIATIISQAVQIAISPLLTRLFNPTEFGIFALFSSVATIIAMLCTGRYDLAVLLPSEDKDSVSIVMLTLAISSSLALLILIAIAVTSHFGFLPSEIGTMRGWLFLIPLGGFLKALNQTLYTWGVREKLFNKLAQNKILLSVVTSVTMLLSGLLGMGGGGLICAFFAGIIYSNGNLGGIFYKKSRSLIKKASVPDLKKVAIRYKKFPLYSLPADSFNVASNQLPTILLTILFGPGNAGYFSLTQRILGAPIAAIGNSTLDVFRQQASRDYEDHGNCVAIYKKTFRTLFLLSIAPFIVLFFAAPKIFTLVFGQDWKIAGQYCQYLAPMFFLRITSSPLGYVFYIAEKQNYDLIWQIILFVLTSGSIVVGSLLHSDKISLISYSVVYSIMYIVYILMSYSFAKGHKRDRAVISAGGLDDRDR